MKTVAKVSTVTEDLSAAILQPHATTTNVLLVSDSKMVIMPSVTEVLPKKVLLLITPLWYMVIPAMQISI